MSTSNISPNQTSPTNNSPQSYSTQTNVDPKNGEETEQPHDAPLTVPQALTLKDIRTLPREALSDTEKQALQQGSELEKLYGEEVERLCVHCLDDLHGRTYELIFSYFKIVGSPDMVFDLHEELVELGEDYDLERGGSEMMILRWLKMRIRAAKL